MIIQFTQTLKPLHVTHPQCRPPRASRPCRRGRGRYRPRARKHSPASPPSSGPSRPPMGSERVVTRPLICHNYKGSIKALRLNLNFMIVVTTRPTPTSSSCHLENRLRPHCSRQMLYGARPWSRPLWMLRLARSIPNCDLGV